MSIFFGAAMVVEIPVCDHISLTVALYLTGSMAYANEHVPRHIHILPSMVQTTEGIV